MEVMLATALIAMSVATGVVIGVGFSLYLIQNKTIVIKSVEVKKNERD